MHADPLSRPAVPRTPRARAIAVTFAVLAALTALAAGGWWWLSRRPPEPAPAPAVAQTPAATPAAAQPEPPAILHPIPSAPGAAEAPDVALPALDASDATLLASLSNALAGTPFERVLVREAMVRRFVATIDNVPRKTIAARLRPVQPTAGLLVTERAGERTVLAPANAARYDDLMRVIEGGDARALVAVYVRHYALFQQAYRELGYPDGYFNDRLVVAIDSLLATPQVDGPIGLSQPRVLYEFADPGLEALPAGQKAMLRLGPGNEARVKAKLREIRALVARS